MASLNRVQLIGNVGNDVELKYTPSNQAVCNLNIATNKRWKDKSGAQKERTEWHRVQVWGTTAENVSKYVRKGSSVYVEGRIQTREYEKDGSKRYATEIVADRVIFLDSKGDGNGRAQHREERAPTPQQGPDDSDLPF